MKVKNYELAFDDRYSLEVPQDFKTNLITIWHDDFDRAIVYNQIISDIEDLEYDNYIHEINYRLAEGETINEILLDIILKEKSTLGYHKGKIQLFLDQDFMDMFK